MSRTPEFARPFVYGRCTVAFDDDWNVYRTLVQRSTPELAEKAANMLRDRVNEIAVMEFKTELLPSGREIPRLVTRPGPALLDAIRLLLAAPHPDLETLNDEGLLWKP